MQARAWYAKTDSPSANPPPNEIERSLLAGKPVTLHGFGTFELKKRDARTGRNPRTGEPVEIAASTSVAFKPAKALKDALN